LIVLSFAACSRTRLVCHELRIVIWSEDIVIRSEDIGEATGSASGAFLQGL
jgi:hypothetical protein